MINISNFVKYYILLYIIINITIKQQNCYEYKIQAEKKESILEPLNIDNSEEDCTYLIPSLFDPILILSQGYKGGILKELVEINIPFYQSKLKGTKYYFDKFLNELQTYGIKFDNSNCYFGLSMGYPNDTHGLSPNEVLLSCLEENKKINKKIFSFDKFTLNENTIDTTFYLGETHNDFTSDNGIVGTCKLNEEDIFWGFSFNEMIFNNKILSLKRTQDNKLYKIYLTTNDYLINFPFYFLNDTYLNELLFNNKCEYHRNDKYYECNNFFNGKDYIPLQLISDDINITLELDNFNRYYSNKNDNKEKILINFSDDNNIIFPLIMFKQFHVQFDAENKVINFYTNDTSLLQVKQEKKETPKNEGEGSSGLTVFLVILIILLVIGIGLGVFYFLRLRRNKIEKDINRFTKFEDEEDFKNMNENKVY